MSSGTIGWNCFDRSWPWKIMPAADSVLPTKRPAQVSAEIEINPDAYRTQTHPGLKMVAVPSPPDGHGFRTWGRAPQSFSHIPWNVRNWLWSSHVCNFLVSRSLSRRQKNGLASPFKHCLQRKKGKCVVVGVGFAWPTLVLFLLALGISFVSFGLSSVC